MKKLSAVCIAASLAFGTAAQAHAQLGEPGPFPADAPIEIGSAPNDSGLAGTVAYSTGTTDSGSVERFDLLSDVFPLLVPMLGIGGVIGMGNLMIHLGLL